MLAPDAAVLLCAVCNNYLLTICVTDTERGVCMPCCLDEALVQAAILQSSG